MTLSLPVVLSWDVLLLLALLKAPEFWIKPLSLEEIEGTVESSITSEVILLRSSSLEIRFRVTAESEKLSSIFLSNDSDKVFLKPAEGREEQVVA